MQWLWPKYIHVEVNRMCSTRQNAAVLSYFHDPHMIILRPHYFDSNPILVLSNYPYCADRNHICMRLFEAYVTRHSYFRTAVLDESTPQSYLFQRDKSLLDGTYFSIPKFTRIPGRNAIALAASFWVCVPRHNHISVGLSEAHSGSESYFSRLIWSPFGVRIIFQ